MRKSVSRVATIYYFRIQFSTKNYETYKYTKSRGKKHTTEIVCERTQISDITNQDFKAVISIFKELKEAILKSKSKYVNVSSKKEYQKREIIKKTKILKLNSTITEMKNLLEILKSRSELTKEIISKLEDKQ